MLESLIKVLEIAMISMCIILLLLFVMINQRNWGKYSLNDQEITILLFRITYSHNLKIILLLSLLLVPASGLFLISSNGFDWHFFVVIEATLIFLYFVHHKWQSTVDKFSQSRLAVREKSSLQKCIFSPKNRVFWLYVGFVGLIALLSISVIYHCNNLFSPDSDVETELIFIIASFIGIGIIAGLLLILPTLRDIITSTRRS